MSELKACPFCKDIPERIRCPRCNKNMKLDIDDSYWLCDCGFYFDADEETTKYMSSFPYIEQLEALLQEVMELEDDPNIYSIHTKIRELLK